MITTEEWAQLAVADVYPLPLAVETNWTSSGWEVAIVMVTEVGRGGHESTAVWSFDEPYSSESPPDGEAAAVTSEALKAFAARLRTLLA
jgi:hypothetical protein